MVRDSEQSVIQDQLSHATLKQSAIAPVNYNRLAHTQYEAPSTHNRAYPPCATPQGPVSQRCKVAHPSAPSTAIPHSAASARNGKEAAAAPKNGPTLVSSKITTAAPVSKPASVRLVALIPVASVRPAAAHARQATESAKGSAVLKPGAASKSALVEPVAAKGAGVPLAASGKFGIVFGLGGLVMAGNAPSTVAASTKAGDQTQPARHGPAQSSVAGHMAGAHGRQGEAQSTNKRKQKTPVRL